MALETAFCRDCQLLFFDQSRIIDDTGERRQFIPLKYEFEDDFPFLPTLTSSAQDGCLMCAFIKDAFWNHCTADASLTEAFQSEARKLRDRPGETPKKVRLILSEYHPRASGWLRDPRTAGPLYIYGQICLETTTSAIRINVMEYDLASRQRFPEGLPLTEKSLRMIHDWVSGCVDSKSDQHAGCSKSRKNIAPLRLLDVMEGDTVRLVKTEGLVLSYAILSYCWGLSTAMVAARTLISNISMRMTAFPLSSLPQTLQDSVTVARRLKVQYIWIDSLCIVQDSDEWLTESKRMMTYYENSYFTIIPIVCSSSDQGFLGPRPRWVSRRLTGTWVGQPDKGLLFYHPNWEHIDDEATNSTWGTRAWTFQERLLSARVVYFGRNGIRFECRGAVYQEVNSYNSEQDNMSKFLTPSIHHSAEWDNIEKVRSMWYQMVSEYVERQLTFESDRLIALSGVAQKFGVFFGDNDEYISGFWKNDLCHGLCWRSWKGWSRKLTNTWSLTKSLSFPSWSWCSMKRPVIWTDGAGSIPCAELFGKILSFDEKQCGGKSEYAKLLLTAWVFSARLLEIDSPKGLEFGICLDAEEELLLETFNAGNEYMAVVMSAYLDGGGEEGWRASPTESLHEAYGLIVESSGTIYDGIEEYRRIGTFDVLRDMETDATEDSKRAAGSFYKQIYASRRTIALV